MTTESLYQTLSGFKNVLN